MHVLAQLAMVYHSCYTVIYIESKFTANLTDTIKILYLLLHTLEKNPYGIHVLSFRSWFPQATFDAAHNYDHQNNQTCCSSKGYNQLVYELWIIFARWASGPLFSYSTSSIGIYASCLDALLETDFLQGTILSQIIYLMLNARNYGYIQCNLRS